MIHGFLLAVISFFPHHNDSILYDKVDMIEINHFVDEEGRKVFTQVLFWDYNSNLHEYCIRAWRLSKPNNIVEPERRWNPTRYVSHFYDGSNEQFRIVEAPQMRETWTQYDPERRNREIFSEDMRKPLTKEITYDEYNGCDCYECELMNKSK